MTPPLDYSKNTISKSPRAICYLPGRESQYVRTRVLKQALLGAGLAFIDCSFPAKRFYRYFFSTFKFLRHIRQSDIVLVGFCGQILVFFVRCFTRKTIIFDAYISIYETLAIERKKFRSHSLLAKLTRFLDKKSCELSDVVLLDTNQHIKYFTQEFSLPHEKFQRFIASCGDIKTPMPDAAATNPPVVLHYSEFQSLHGVQYIVQAAQGIPEAQFILIGKGPTLKNCQRLAQQLQIANLRFYDTMPYPELLGHIAKADICLGIFGGTPKASMVIPNKIYDYLALRKATITQESAAIKEIFTENRDLIVCKAQNPDSLAASIKNLLSDPSLRKRIAQSGYETFQQKCSIKVLATQLRRIIDDVRK